MSEERKAVQFIPVRGLDSKINNKSQTPIKDGFVYFATDSGKIYVDSQGERVAMGAAGAAIYYGSTEKPLPDGDYFLIPINDVSGTPKVGDLILNADGGFYKVGAINGDNYTCAQLSVSGNGSFVPTTSQQPTCILTMPITSFINGQTATFHVSGESAKDANGNPIDTDLYVNYWLYPEEEGDHVLPYYKGRKYFDTSKGNYEPGKIDVDIEFHEDLQHSRTSRIEVWIECPNNDKPESPHRRNKVDNSELKLSKQSGWSPNKKYFTSGFDITCTVEGSCKKIVEFYYDDMRTPKEVKYESGAEANLSFSVAGDVATHGYHTVKIVLYQNLGDEKNPEYGYPTDPIQYEIAVVKESDASQKPIIWLGDYQDTYYNYDSIKIPYLVYDPQNTSKTIVHLYKNNKEIGTREISSTTPKNNDGYYEFEIVDAVMGRINTYQISCGETDARREMREVKFKILEDPIRTDFVPVSDNLLLNFSAAGRSNDESPATRGQWSYVLKESESDPGEVKNAIFEKFTWTDKNGWTSDTETGQTRLTISNGSKLTIPFKVMDFAQDASGKESHTIEMQIRVRNIQKYGALIQNITRYVGDDAEGGWYDQFIAQKATGYDNYDAFLQATLSASVYEQLKFRTVQKDININNVVGGLYTYSPESKTAVGFCIGTEDTFFSNGQDTVNVNFVENDLINLSFVYHHGLKLIYIYINGVITGVIRSYEGKNQPFSINETNIVFDSKYCDIDLYKLRIYNTNLNVNQIVLNYAADRKLVETYDQSKIYKFATENQALQEYQLQFDSIEQYNIKNPKNPTMPYIIFDTGLDALPYTKEIPKTIKVEFVNAPLDAAYHHNYNRLVELAREDGLIPEGNDVTVAQIEEGVRTYYMHHCPSWISNVRSSDLVNFEVQGTSSEFYPRRNYKVKTKMEGKFNWKPAEEFSAKDLEELDEEQLAKLQEEGGLFEEEEALNIFMHKGPFATEYQTDVANAAKDTAGKLAGKEATRMVDGWYMNNYTNPTDRWTMKVDFMESSGSYNAGLAGLVGNAYTKHPLQDYIDKGLLTNTSELKPVIDSPKYTEINWDDFRTSLLGFPVMAFQKMKKNGKDKYIFLGYYRMLLDKSSTQVLGFKTPKKVTNKLFPAKYNDDGSVKEYSRVRDIAECWEFSNNARGFCSYRDPWNRVELSFLAPVGAANEWVEKTGAPIVANSFEYRYHSKDDFIDKLYAFDEQKQADLDEVAAEFGLEGDDVPVAGDRASAKKAFMIPHRNWENLVKWVWSTNLDAVASQGRYEYVLVSNIPYEPNKYYLVDENAEGGFALQTADKIDPTADYYKYDVDPSDPEGKKMTYLPIRLCDPDNLFSNEEKQFYYQSAGLNTPDDLTDDIYVLASGRESFDNQTDYYIFIPYADEELETKFDRLVRPVDLATETFNAGTQYYLFNGSKEINPLGPTGAVTKVATPNEEDFNAGKYYIAFEKKYGKTTYKYDTKEYRSAKFMNEFEDHFDPEYVATYFVMSEVLELYDSRGKNCMMASWGPHKAGGDYIWYPIFYDMDTQLGINNTGIPSFQFNVDATDAGNYSTSDSILWNNFYAFFKKIWMIPKYRNLKGDSSKFDFLVDKKTNLSKAPLQSTDFIEKWYSFDPDTYHSIACEGIRPLIATNLDMYFKYITICNEKAQQEDVAHLGGAGSGGAFAEPDTGTYFYALQGDRSQSRRQFVESRIDYIDSWLGQGNYIRGGQNCVWGRISANNRSDKDSNKIDVHSDKWTETATKRYWVNDEEFGTKTHEFDAEYWLEPVPMRSAYFTAGDDSANYASKKYDGIKPLKFKLSELENGIRRSDNYPEQLLYIYGTDKMTDLGDLSKMYWTEFKITGNADKLTRLKLGHDATTFDYPNDNATEKSEISWYNKKLNSIVLPSTGLPLLKEANFCNITLTAPAPLNLEKSDKLENFRATGSSGISNVVFSKGVALNTLYLPANMTSLALDSAQLLTNLIGYVDKDNVPVPGVQYEVPTKQEGKIVANPGLYLEGFFSGESSLNTIEFHNDALGYGSYRLLKRLYDKYKGFKGEAKATMTDVNWCPYTKLIEGDVYDSTKTYYVDNGHYGFATYTNVGDKFSENQFKADILSGKVYCDNRESSEFNDDVLFVDDSAIEMLTKMAENSNFKSAANGSIPEITGIIYIHNTDGQYDEMNVYQILQKAYPNLTFFFNSIKPAYSARFVLVDKETGAENWVGHAKAEGYGPSVQKIATTDIATKYFSNPYDLYKVKRDHWDFFGWATTPSGKKEDGSSSIIIGTIPEGVTDEKEIINIHGQAWNNAKSSVIVEGEYDYTFYAILTEHDYVATFKDVFSTYEQKSYVKYSEEGAFMNANVPAPVNHGAAELYMRNTFKGWTEDPDNAKVYASTVSDNDLPLVNVEEYPATDDYVFYAVYREESVFNQVISSDFFNFPEINYTESVVDGGDTSYNIYGCSITLKEEFKNKGYLDGKITLPTVSPTGQPVICLGSMQDNGITHIFFEKNDNRPNEVRYITNGACSDVVNLQYVDFVNMPKLREIKSNAFNNCTRLDNIWTFNDPLYKIADFAFASAGFDLSGRINIILNPMLKNLGRRAFAMTKPIQDITFGAPGKPSQLNPEDWLYNGSSNRNAYVFGHNTGNNPSGTVTIYCKADDKANWDNWLDAQIHTSPLIILSETKDGLPTYVFVN